MAEAQELSSTEPRVRWRLTKEAFDGLLRLLDADANVAGERYLVLRRNLVRFFEGRGCRFAEDHADEVINRLAKRCADGEVINDLNGYAYGVARLLLLETFKEQAKQERALKEMATLAPPDAGDFDHSREQLACLARCLERLPPEGRQLVLKYYEGDNQSRIKNRKRMTEALGIPNQALRSRALRLREKLESCLSNCLKHTDQRHRFRVSATKHQGEL